jgi:hypothetical protein
MGRTPSTGAQWTSTPCSPWSSCLWRSSTGHLQMVIRAWLKLSSTMYGVLLPARCGACLPANLCCHNELLCVTAAPTSCLCHCCNAVILKGYHHTSCLQTFLKQQSITTQLYSNTCLCNEQRQIRPTTSSFIATETFRRHECCFWQNNSCIAFTSHDRHRASRR